jgi:hypothetical protein
MKNIVEFRNEINNKKDFYTALEGKTARAMGRSDFGSYAKRYGLRTNGSSL